MSEVVRSNRLPGLGKKARVDRRSSGELRQLKLLLAPRIAGMLGTKTDRNYRVIRSLGQGSNAEVFLAQPLRAPETRVVLKRIHRHVAALPKFRQLFDAEVRSMAKFSHPYAVRFISASLDDPNGPCLVMEYVNGITLEALLARHRRLPADRVGRLLAQTCHALQAAHTAGIIHRDIKPANVMVVNAGATDESVKVMDFGFAGFSSKPHLQLAELTGKGSVFALGTPGYVSPEMIRGDTVDGRCDLYSLGIMAYELLTGRLPFNVNDEQKLLQAHVSEPPPRFHRIGCAFLSIPLEGVIQRVLEKFPNERYQSARELAEALGAATGEKDLWAKTAPKDYDAMSGTVEIQFTPPPRPAPNLPIEPYRVSFSFDAVLPEKMAAAKIKGFVGDFSGVVIDSDPGRIHIRLGASGRFRKPEPAANGSSILSWFKVIRKPLVQSGNEPIDIELCLDKPDPTSPRVKVTINLRPLPEFLPKDRKIWQTRCERLRVILRQYLGG